MKESTKTILSLTACMAVLTVPSLAQSNLTNLRVPVVVDFLEAFSYLESISYCQNIRFLTSLQGF